MDTKLFYGLKQMPFEKETRFKKTVHLSGYEERAGQVGLSEADQRDRGIYRTAGMREDIYGEDVRERAQSIAV